MHPRLVAMWDELRSSYWFVPALMTLGASLLALSLITLDATLSDKTIAGLPWIYGGGPEGARTLLATVAGSVITVAGTTFSITIAALTLASSQFGPRLLRTFVRDTGNQVVLGTFIATFMYCLIVLRTIRGLEDTRVVPHISVTIGVLLAVASIGVLIYFIHHVAASIQADHVISAVSADLDDSINRLFPHSLGHDTAEEAHPVLDQAGVSPETSDTPIRAGTSGYLQMVDAEQVMHLAVKHHLLLRIVPRPGDFVFAGSPLAWSPGPVDDELARAIGEAFVIGDTRTQHQDVRLAINQLVEVAVRALSPSVNDPFTAISCIDRLGAALCKLAGRAMPGSHRSDQRGELRVIAPAPSFAELASLAFEPIRHHGRTDPQVLRHLLATLGVVSTCISTTAQLTALRQIAEQVRQAGKGLADSADRARVDAEAQAWIVQLSQRLAQDAGDAQYDSRHHRAVG